MSVREHPYEVRVRVKGKVPRGYSSLNGCYFYPKLIKMFHTLAKSTQQAMDKCRKHGEPISARKVNVGVMFKDIERLELEAPYGQGNPYNSALAMDEMIWHKRNARIANRHKDKSKTY